MPLYDFEILVLAIISTTFVVAGVSVGIYQLRDLKKQSLELNEQTKQSENETLAFLETRFMERFDDVINNSDTDADVTIKRFFDLCWEEYWLSERKLIVDGELWDLWQRGMQYELEKRADLRDGWEKVKQQDYEKDFQTFMDGKVAGAKLSVKRTI